MVTAVVGANWGDEGKGKFVDLLSKDADIVVRYQGGANAGHTIVNEFGKNILHMLPSGVFRSDVVNVIGQGVAFNIKAFVEELKTVQEAGMKNPQIIISDRVQVLMPYHIRLDELEEQRLGKNSFGSTKSGIAPFYSDKYAKIGFQISELFDENLFEKFNRILLAKNKSIAALYGSENQINIEAAFEELMKAREVVKPYLRDVTKFLHESIKSGKRILLEGQLGALRDTDNGIYPFVTSSSPIAGFSAVGAGIPPYEIKRIITIVKAYSSCVGAGEFVTELFGEEAKKLRDAGNEYGATTKRPRRVGPFDAVASRYGCMLQGTTEVVLSLLDVLGYMDEIPVCVAYEINGEEVKDFPVTTLLGRAKPVYKYLKGWKCDISKARTFNELPDEAKEYVSFIEKELDCPITMISNGPKRSDLIIRK